MTNNDLISRSELLAEIDRERKRHIDSGNYGAEHLMVHSMRRLAEEAPAVDAAPVVHGNWIPTNKSEHDINCVDHITGTLRITRREYFHFTCSECRKISMMDHTIGYAFCPHCGARMDKEE